ncbi:MAG TPA: glycolate oxidase subunit GlcE [Chromatiaceae bacterium]|nr:glycolate oxidase subunit GlcE [Chromatiaceae bacterium]
MEELAEQIRTCWEEGRPVVIRGGNTKHFLGRFTQGEVIDTRKLGGILDYQPEELFIRAAAGTPLREVEQTLAEKGQMLPFEPPAFGDTATLGGTISSGLSGPSRPWRGAARDFVLGCRLINGRGELLHFGGEVIKNVAGYDVSRLQCGAFGTLGLITELSLKTMPLPRTRRTLCFKLDLDTALAQVRVWNRQPLPISGAAWWKGRLYLRLEGARSAVGRAAQLLGGESSTEDDFWHQLREHRLTFFDSPLPLWRISLPRSVGAIDLPGDVLIDWGGAQRWLLSDAPAESIQAATKAAGGHAISWRNDALLPKHSSLLAIHQRLKQAFDPGNILNPGRLHPEL